MKLKHATPVLPIYKPVGSTPLEMLHMLRVRYPELKNEKLAYAGRLDPMAEGMLLVLVGEECKKREHYQMLPKTYEVTGVFGITTDTYDALGLVEKVTQTQIAEIPVKLKKLLPSLIGRYEQPYPPYSSARVKGKPLFYWARKGLINTITIPKKHIQITNISITENKTTTSDKLLKTVSQKITKVAGDFRQDKILETWEEKLEQPYTFACISFEVHATQGAYMRSLIHDMGGSLNIGAIALSIKRVSVGEFTIRNAIIL